MSGQKSGGGDKTGRSPVALRLVNADRRDRAQGMLPPDCPVVPLGGNGAVFWYLNAIGQLISVASQQHSKNVITSMFAPRIDYLMANFPKTFDKVTGDASDFKSDHVARALMHDAQMPGRSWEPSDNIRGRGTWLGEDGDLVVHLGSTLVAGGQAQRPGLHGAHVYPVRPNRPAPAPDAQAGGDAGPAAELLALMEQWNWVEPRLHPRLLLGYVCSTFLAGALHWRPHLWLVAPRGAGKSTFFRMLSELLAKGEGFLSFEDTSAAALRIKLQFDALGVALDETEPSEDNARINQILQLLRLASSGGTTARGTADHGSVEHTLRFPAICASVVRPALKGQDATRITLIEMRKPSGDSMPPLLKESVLRLLGRRLFKRMLDAWPRYQETLELWRTGIRRGGLDPRGADQLGVLLALQWVALHDEAPDTDSIDEWCELARVATAPDRVEDRPEWFRCIEVLSHWRLRTPGGQQDLPVSELLETAAFGTRVLEQSDTGSFWRGTTPKEADAAQAILARSGLRFAPLLDDNKRLIRRHRDDAERICDHLGDGMALGYLAVANAHPELARFFERTQWAARAGTAGAWKGVLEGAPGMTTGGAVRFGARTARCVQVPLELVFNTHAEAEEA